MKPFALVISLLCMFVLPGSALACACCIDPGYYSISTSKPTSYELGMLDEMKFDSVGNLYETEAGFDGIRGLDALRKDEANGDPIELSMVGAFLNRTWKFTFTSKGRPGTLVLPMPTTMLRFKVDQHQNEPGTEPFLYKELRFKGVVSSGNGLFNKDIAKPTSYFLVFQGHGNGCDSSADYSHWRLELSGPKAEFAFFGKMQ